MGAVGGFWLWSRTAEYNMRRSPPRLAAPPAYEGWGQHRGASDDYLRPDGAGSPHRSAVLCF